MHFKFFYLISKTSNGNTFLHFNFDLYLKYLLGTKVNLNF